MADADRWWRQVQAKARRHDLSVAEQRQILYGGEPRLRLLMAVNPALHPDLQSELLDRPRYWQALAVNPGLTGELQRTMAESTWREAQLALLARSDLDSELQVVLAGSRFDEVRRTLAGHRRIGAEAAWLLARDRGSVRVLAMNPRIPSKVLCALMADSDRRTMEFAAGNPSLPAGAQLSDGKPESVQAALAGNRGLVPEAAFRLALDRPLVRMAAAGNPALPSALLHQLYAQHPGAHPMLAGNPATAGAMLGELCERARTDGSLVAPLAANPSLPLTEQEWIVRTAGPEALERLAGNPSSAPDIQLRLARCESLQVRGTLAANPGLAPGAGQVLCTDDHPAVRRRLAVRGDLPAGMMLTLAADEDFGVLHALERRPDYDRSHLRALLLGLLGDDRAAGPRRRILAHIAHWDGRGGGLPALELPMAGPALVAISDDRRLIERAARHGDPVFRLAALTRGVVDPDHADSAMSDPDPDVARAAKLALLASM